MGGKTGWPEEGPGKSRRRDRGVRKKGKAPGEEEPGKEIAEQLEEKPGGTGPKRLKRGRSHKGRGLEGRSRARGGASRGRGL